LLLPGFEDSSPPERKKKEKVSWSRTTNIICPDCLCPVREFHIDGRSCFYCDIPQRCHIVMGNASDPFNGLQHLTQRQWQKVTRLKGAPSRNGLN
jgi:hypothetical protein